MTEQEPRIDALEELASELERTAPSAPRIARRHALRVGGLVGALVIAVLVAASFTPPGRAVAEHLGSLVGIGDEPTRDGEGRDAVVIGVGDANSIPYEVVATGRNESVIVPPGEPPVLCISLEIPDALGDNSGNCLTAAARRDVQANSFNAFIYGAPAELYPQAEIIVQGLAVPRVDAVLVSYETVDGQAYEVSAEISDLDDRLADRIEIERDVRFFVAFLPPHILGAPEIERGPLTRTNARQALSDIEVIAYSADGQEIRREGGLSSPTAISALVYAPPRARFAHGKVVNQLTGGCVIEESMKKGPPSTTAIDRCVVEALKGFREGER